MARDHQRKKKRHFLVRLAGKLIMLGLLVYCCIFAFVLVQEYVQPRPQQYDAMIVLGSRVKADGTPGENLTMRLEAALEAYQAHPCLIITCGGQGSDEPAPEGDVMRQWLIDRGVPADRIISESISTNTQQSITAAAQMLRARGIKGAVIVTSAYHVPRAMAMVRDEGLAAQGWGCEYTTEGFDWWRHHLRETLSWIKYWGEKLLVQPGGDTIYGRNRTFCAA